MDIGRQAELYAHEKNYTTALDSFQSALGALVPLLQKEPKGLKTKISYLGPNSLLSFITGPRRDMLHSQIKEWMDEAENIKGFLENKDNEADGKTINDDHHACVLQ